jgi:DNA replication and repair protein RecF
VHVEHLILRDVRRYEYGDFRFGPGVTSIIGANGAGKTTVLEAVGYYALGRSLRGVPDAALVRDGAETASIQAVLVDGVRRRHAEIRIPLGARSRVIVEGQALTRARDRADLLRITVFAPDDLRLVKGGPSERREYLDDLLTAYLPRYAGVRADYDRVLRQRNALLKVGTRGADALTTLDVFDQQLAGFGGDLVAGRLRLVGALEIPVGEAYQRLSARLPAFRATYEADWNGTGPLGIDVERDELTRRLHRALQDARSREIERRITLVGPHRDEWRLRLDGLDSRTHSSQGEQRTLALALRLGGHEVIRAQVGQDPVLLLDDVFSELDDRRAALLAENLPPGQTLLTTAARLPDAVRPDAVIRVDGGRIVEPA